MKGYVILKSEGYNQNIFDSIYFNEKMAILISEKLNQTYSGYNYSVLEVEIHEGEIK